MKTGVIILCRMNSSRLPGKPLADVCGRPLLSYLCDRLQPLQDDGISIVVATSDAWHDDSIQDYCESQDIHCFRGSLNHVAQRMLACAEQYGFDWFARVNGDSPFVDSELLRKGFEICPDRHFDFITNLAPRSYPYGVAVEILRTSWLERLEQTQPLLIDPEHVTARFYNNLHQIRYYNVSQVGNEHTRCQLTIDSREDLNWFRGFIAEHCSQWPQVSFEDAVADRQPMRKVA